MSDVFCQKCGEPWDSFGIIHARGEGDLTPSEAVRFMKGKGCPCCHWGKHCLMCNGSGREILETSDCECRGSRTLIMRRLSGGQGTWQHGTYPKIRLFDGEPAIIHKYPDGSCRDGRFEEALILCPFCGASAPPCPACKGTGKLQPLTLHEYGKAISSLIEASDEDVITLYLLP